MSASRRAPRAAPRAAPAAAPSAAAVPAARRWASAAAGETAAERESRLAEEASAPKDTAREVFDAIWRSEEDAYVRSTQRSSFGGRSVAKLPKGLLAKVRAKGFEIGQDLSGVPKDALRLAVLPEDAPEEGTPVARAFSFDNASQAEINQARIKATIERHRHHDTDTGSPEAQIAVLTQRLRYGELHMRQHPKDVHSRRGIDVWRTRRRKLLAYLKESDHVRFLAVCEQLNLPVKRTETREDIEADREKRREKLRRTVGTPSKSMKKRLNVIKRRQEREQRKLNAYVGAAI